MTKSEDWGILCEKAQQVVNEQMVHSQESDDRKKPPTPGLRQNQREIIRHILQTLPDTPGLIVAERTGLGKSLIAIATMAALARVRADMDAAPFRVGLLAPNEQVLANWLPQFSGALDKPGDETRLWRQGRWPWRVVCPRLKKDGPDNPARLHVFADHYSRGITNGYGTWGNDAVMTRERAKEFLGGGEIKPLDLLIIDEAHQLKNSRSDRAEALGKIFGGESPALPARRVLLMTATPFQLRAAPELVRLITILRWPQAMGIDFPPAFLARTGAQVLADLFDRYRRVVVQWLGQRMDGHSAERSHEAAFKVKEDVESILRNVIVRTDTPIGMRTNSRVVRVVTRYGQPNHELGKRLPAPGSGLSCETDAERLLFLAWDGSIASRTTFVATEQQTLTSSVGALLAIRDGRKGDSAVVQKRRPLAPPMVADALFNLSLALGTYVRPDHVKVRATIDAVCRRLEWAARHRESQSIRRATYDPVCEGLQVPVLIFAERIATLELLRAEIRTRLPGDVRVEVLHGNTPPNQRRVLVEEFNRSAVHVLLASKVAEMGLDIDGPPDSENIWLIHHDFPWNPAMVEQRNGRVIRGAKGIECTTDRTAYITYPFIQDTVDERIFKRMLARQAIAELLLGTDDVARALRLTDQSNLDAIDINAAWTKEFRQLSPDLSPAPTRIKEHSR